jgi:hypothetical protein
MISSENIPLSDQHRNKLTHYIKELDEFLNKSYPIATLIASFSTLIFILFLISLYEEHGFSIGLKLLTIVPLWAIVMINIKYFHNRFPARMLRRMYNKVLEDNCYQVIRVKATSCAKYSDALYHYLLFHTDGKKQVLLKLQDFTVDKGKFPNDDFVIPPYQLSDIVGNEIVCEGRRIEPVDNNDIHRKLVAFRLFEKGRIMITDGN